MRAVARMDAPSVRALRIAACLAVVSVFIVTNELVNCSSIVEVLRSGAVQAAYVLFGVTLANLGNSMPNEHPAQGEPLPEAVNWQQLSIKAGQVFKPGAPVDDVDMLRGR